MSARTRAAALFLALSAAVAVLAGCGTPPTAPAGLATPAPPRPSDVHERALVTQASPICPGSLRPPQPFPQPGAPQRGAVGEIQRHGQLRVGVGFTANRLSFRDPLTGQMTGFEVEIARRIARAVFGDDRPERVVFVAVNAQDRPKVLRSRSVDMLLASVTMACDRRDDDDAMFSAAYYTATERVLVPRDSTAESLTDLGGRRICASNNSTNIRHIASWPAHPRLIPFAATNTADCLVMLQQHQVAGILTDDLILAGLYAQDPTTKILTGPDDRVEPTGVEMSKDVPDLVRFVNGVLEQIRADGTWARLQRYWLAPFLPRPSRPATPPIPVYTDCPDAHRPHVAVVGCPHG